MDFDNILDLRNWLKIVNEIQGFEVISMVSQYEIIVVMYKILDDERNYNDPM